MDRPRWRALSWLGALVLAASACMTVEVTHRPAQPRSGTGSLQAGVARVDITPIPGLPMGGHGPGGQDAFGVFTPLHARAIYLEDEAGVPLALVSMDVWGVSEGLRDSVVEKLHVEHGLTHLDVHHVVLAATHTHHSSAAFATDCALNLGSGRTPSLSKTLFDRYVSQIAAVIANAHDNRRPARARYSKRPVYDYARNRSLAPFERNEDAAAIVADHPFPPSCMLPQLPEHRPAATPESCLAVDPMLRGLRLEDEATGELIGAAIFANVHNTTMPNSSQAYSADFFGLAASRLEARCDDRCVIAFFNGAEGDVSPTWRRQSLEALHRSASIMEDSVGAMLADPRASRLTPRLQVRGAWYELARASRDDDDDDAQVTASWGMVGRAALGGAEDGILKRDAQPFVGEGTVKTRPRGRHGHKRHSLLRPIRRWMQPYAPLQWIELGGSDGLTMVSIPGEATTVEGRRARLAASPNGEPDDVVILGLSNAYRGYFTTKEEYALQHYEGGQTWWGAAQGDVLVDRVGCLVRGADDDALRKCGLRTTAPRESHYAGLIIEHGLHHRRISNAKLRDARAQNLTLGTEAPTAEGHDLSALTFRLARPAPPWWPRDAGRSPPVPRVSIERQTGPCTWEPLEIEGLPEDDDRGRTLTSLINISRGGQRQPDLWHWEIAWLFASRMPDHSTIRMVAEVSGARVCSESVSSSQRRWSSLSEAPCACGDAPRDGGSVQADGKPRRP